MFFSLGLRLDEVAWVKHGNAKKKQAAREHILAVTHEKAQNAVGKGKLVFFVFFAFFLCCQNVKN